MNNINISAGEQSRAVQTTPLADPDRESIPSLCRGCSSPWAEHCPTHDTMECADCDQPWMADHPRRQNIDSPCLPWPSNRGAA